MQLVVAILRTVVALHGGVTEVDAADEAALWGDISAEDAAQTMIPTGTDRTVAYQIGRSFLAETLFNLFLCHVMIQFNSGAKIIKMWHIYK